VIISPSRCSSVIPNHLNSDSYDQSTLGLYLINTGLRLADGGKPVPDWRAPVGCRRSRRPNLTLESLLVANSGPSRTILDDISDRQPSSLRERLFDVAQKNRNYPNSQINIAADATMSAARIS
jgi:hypothetical protein